MAFGVSITRAQNTISPVQGAPTSVVGLLTITSWGPTDDPAETTSFPEWQKVWGPPTLNGFGYLWAEQAYKIAGPGLRVVTHRVVHLSNIANRASKTSAPASLTVNTDALAATHGSVTTANTAPFSLVSGETLVPITDIGTATATFTGVAPHTDSGSAPFTLSDGLTLTLKVNRGSLQTIVFNTAAFVSIGAATLLEVEGVINAYFASHSIPAAASIASSKVRISSNKAGTGGYIEIVGGTGQSALGYTIAETQGTGNVEDISSVTLAEVTTIVELALPSVDVTDAGGGLVTFSSTTSGSASSIQINASSTADTPMGLDNAAHTGSASGAIARMVLTAKYDGLRGNNLSVKITAATSGDDESFNFLSLENGVQAPGNTGVFFPNLSVDPDSSRYFVTILNDTRNGSSLFTVTDSASGNVALPAIATTAKLSGGADGLGSLGDSDFNGDPDAKTGMYAFTPIESVPGTSDISILAIPDRNTTSVHNNAVTYCEVVREGDIHFIVDMPSSLTADQAIQYITATSGLLGLSEFTYVVYDWVNVDNSRPDVFGALAGTPTVTIPNSCVVAGVWARTDAARPGGVSDPPAGFNRAKVNTVVRGLEMGEAQDSAKFQKLRDNRINAIIRFNNGPFFIRGALGLRGDGQFPDIQESRLASFIKKSLEFTFQGEMDSPTEEGIAAAAVEARVFLRKLTLAPFNCFRHRKPSDAFAIDTGPSLNTASSMFEGNGFMAITIATKKSLKNLGVTIGQNLADIQAELASQRAA